MDHVSRLLSIAVFGLLILCGSLPRTAHAEGQFIDIAPKSKADIELILNTLDDAIANNESALPPIVMMLHGQEAHRFLRGNYPANKALVDQAAKLAAYKVIKVQICSVWLKNNNYGSDALFPFVEAVPFGAGELERLAREEGYIEWSVSL